MAQEFDGMDVELDGDVYSLSLETFPQGRNGIRTLVILDRMVLKDTNR